MRERERRVEIEKGSIGVTYSQELVGVLMQPGGAREREMAELREGKREEGVVYHTVAVR